MSGTVYLVGAGPGAADLLTLRAARLLGEADIVFANQPEQVEKLRQDKALRVVETPLNGLVYLGLAEGQRGTPAFLRGLAEPPEGTALRPRSLAGELAALESDLLRDYRPPASIERHPDFIAVSADVTLVARGSEALAARWSTASV